MCGSGMVSKGEEDNKRLNLSDTRMIFWGSGRQVGNSKVRLERDGTIYPHFAFLETMEVVVLSHRGLSSALLYHCQVSQVGRGYTGAEVALGRCWYRWTVADDDGGVVWVSQQGEAAPWIGCHPDLPPLNDIPSTNAVIPTSPTSHHLLTFLGSFSFVDKVPMGPGNARNRLGYVVVLLEIFERFVCEIPAFPTTTISPRAQKGLGELSDGIAICLVGFTQNRPALGLWTWEVPGLASKLVLVPGVRHIEGDATPEDAEVREQNSNSRGLGRAARLPGADGSDVLSACQRCWERSSGVVPL